MDKAFRLLLSLMLLSGNNLINAQSNFNNAYFNNGNLVRANSIIQTSDGGYLFAGTDNLLDNLSIAKIDFKGDTLWTLLYDFGNGGADIVYSTIEIIEGGYIIGGLTADIAEMKSNAFLIKININGDIVWKRKIGLVNQSERCYNVKQTEDGGFILTGIRYNIDSSGNTTDSDVYLVKADSAGFPQWEKTYGGISYDFGEEVLILKEGGYLIFGTTYSFGIGLNSMYLIKTDGLGNMLWQKTYGGISKDYGSSIIQTSDGNYVLAGNTYINTDTLAAYVLKIDTAGLVIWEKKFKGPLTEAEFTSIKELPNGDLVACGHVQKDTLNFQYYGMLKRLNANGDAIWEKEYKYFQVDSTQHYFFSMDLTNDGGYVMAGMVADYHDGADPTNGMWVVKTDSLGCDSIFCSSVNVKEINPVYSCIGVYPNPSASYAKFTYYIPSGSEVCSLKIYYFSGQLIESFPIHTDGIGEIIIDLNTMANGLYYCNLISSNGIISKTKMIILK